MTFLLSIDCGMHGLGAALFFDRDLARAAYLRGVGGQVHPWLEPLAELDDFLASAGEPVEELAIEIPQVYQGPRQKGRQSDVVHLAIVAGAVMGRCAIRGCRTVCPMQPAEWKGQVDGDVMVNRIRGRLTPDELACVELPAKSVQHNVWDGIGIGLKRLGRL